MKEPSSVLSTQPELFFPNNLSNLCYTECRAWSYSILQHYVSSTINCTG